MNARRLSLPTILLAAAVSAAAQSDASLSGAETLARAALAEGRASAAAAAAKAPKSCPDARELETPFEATLVSADGSSRTIPFAYAGCREEGRNDYLPPYTERDYEGPDGYGLTVLTDEGADSSEVLLSRGGDWAGNFGKIANADLLSGNPVPAGDAAVEDGDAARKVAVSLRDAAKPIYPQTAACDAAIGKEVGSSPRDAQGRLSLGFSPFGSGPSLALLTASDAYYYHEDCDICAALDRCDLKTGAVSNAITAHSVDCSDMAPLKKGSAPVYDACAAR